jgi:hypothetical protein
VDSVTARKRRNDNVPPLGAEPNKRGSDHNRSQRNNSRGRRADLHQPLTVRARSTRRRSHFRASRRRRQTALAKHPREPEHVLIVHGKAGELHASSVHTFVAEWRSDTGKNEADPAGPARVLRFPSSPRRRYVTGPASGFLVGISGYCRERAHFLQPIP